MPEKKLLHIGVGKESVGRYVFVPGSVERATLIARRLENPVLVSKNREFLVYTGYLEGVKVSVLSTGIGSTSCSLALEELRECGCDTFVRIGSCASMSEKTRIGDVLVPSGAVRMEGVGLHFFPIEFPAVPDYRLFVNLKNAARESGYRFNTGVTVTKDSFYTEARPETKAVYAELKYKWLAYEKAGATNTCMECAPLFLFGSAMNVRTAAVLISATNHNDYGNDKKDYPLNIEERAIDVAVEGVRKMIVEDLKLKKEI